MKKSSTALEGPGQVVGALLSVLAGCGAPLPSGPTYHGEIAPLVGQHCAGCHTTSGIAPFALDTLEAVRAHGPDIKRVITDRSMPPWLAVRGCAEYQDDLSLSDEQIATLTRWVDSGTPAGEPSQSAPAAAASPAGLSRIDATIGMDAPYLPTGSPDDYRCFILDWPAATTRYATGFLVRPGNAAIVHHVLAYVVDAPQVAKYQALDDADPYPGYSCFGSGPDGTQSAMLTSPVRTLAGWAPGLVSGDFPPGTGIRIEPGSKIILQVHYNLLNAPGTSDRTQVDFKLDDAVQKEAEIMPWSNPAWLAGNLHIPAGNPSVDYQFAIDPTALVGFFPGNILTRGQPFVVYSSMLHMHLRGKSGRIEIERADGSSDCMLDVRNWNFHWQLPYSFVEPKQVRPGDKLSVACNWDNSAGHQPVVDGQLQPPRDLSWGEGTNDEMCVAFLYVTP